MKLREKLADWGMWSQVVATLIATAILGAVGVLAAIAVWLWPGFRAWFLDPISYARLGVAIWAGAALVVGFVVGAFVSRRGKDSAKRPAPKFKPITVEDRVLGIEWHIKLDPQGWVDDHKIKQHGYQFHESILAGPYHSPSGCRAELALDSHGYGYSPELKAKCPGCDATIFLPRQEPQIWAIRSQALTELQRLKRAGTDIKGTVALEKPEYWKYLRPPKG